MAENRISAAALGDLSCRIADLEDVPTMDAASLKQYFDTSPQELLTAHNALVTALTSTHAAQSLGFQATEHIPASSIQEAIEHLQQQIDTLTQEQSG